MKKHRIAVVAGDGIGKEVVPEGQRVLEAAGRKFGFELAWDEKPWSCEHYAKHGEMMPKDGLESIRNHDAIFLGAVGFPGVPDHVSLWGLLIPIRRQFRQYVNLRPIRVFDGVPTPVVGAKPGMDFVVVRENVEGEYSEVGGRFNRGFPDEMAVQESIFTRPGVTRILDYAFELAATRRGHVTSATKSNGIVHTMPFWDELVAEAGARHPAVEWRQEHIDALVAKIVLDPSRFDVIVGSNLFGDILSDLAAAVAGSIGITPAGNIDPTREFPSMFEPVHGSAPDIAGQQKADPTAAILSAALLCDHLGLTEAAAAIEAAVTADIEERTAGGTRTTSEIGDAIAKRAAG